MIQTPGKVPLEYDFGLIDLIPIGALVLQSDLTVIFWNKRLEDWTKFPKDKIVGKKITDIVLHFADSLYSKRLNSVFEAGLPIIFSSQLHKCVIPVRQENGDFRIQHTIVTPIKAPGNGYYALFTIQDVTALNNRIEDFRKARDKALNEIEERRKVEEKLRIAKTKAENVEKKFMLLSMLDSLTGLANRRPGDLVARYGGEEIAIILPSTNEQNALEGAKDMRKLIENLKIPRKNTEVSKYVTMSAGVASVTPEQGMSPEFFFHSADQALFRAKSGGRNRVEVGIMSGSYNEKYNTS